MNDRIGTLHVRCHARSAAAGGAIASALLLRLSGRLEDALAEQLATAFGGDDEVVVIRELAMRATLTELDSALDARVVDVLSRAAVDAVHEFLGSPPATDAVMRFPDHAAFVGSFVVDLLAGSAWDRWYYSAFLPHRHADRAATLAAVLAAERPHLDRVLAWLARHGRLADVLALLGEDAVADLVAGPASETIGADAHVPMPLTEAAFDVLAALGWPTDAATRATLVTDYAATTPPAPSWRDRCSLSAWVLAFIRFSVAALRARGRNQRLHEVDAAHELLAGRLDWLDGAWLAEHLRETVRMSAGAAAAGEARPSPRFESLDHKLSELAHWIRTGRLRIAASIRPDDLVRLLLAATHDADPSVAPTALAAIIATVAAAYAEHQEHVDALHATSARAGADRGVETSPGAAGPDAVARTLERVSPAGPAAADLLHALIQPSSPSPDHFGERTAGASVYLLTRAMMDVALPGLVRRAGVPFPPLRAALATLWLDLAFPFDGPVRFWTGADHTAIADLEDAADGLAVLQRELLERLIAQGTLTDAPHDVPGFDAIDGSAVPSSVRPALERIAWMVVRAWSRWLPGLGDASVAFLRRNCLHREGRVFAGNRVEVELEPAPFAVVVGMARYLEPIERVPWLDDRTIAFRPSTAG